MEIKPYPKNAKKHPDKQLKQIANSLRTFGWQQPIVVDKEGTIIVGHGRWEAYKKYPEGIKEPRIEVADLTEEQAKTYRLVDNKLNESEWDMGLAIEELKGLSDEMFDLTGFDKYLITEPDEKDDIIPEKPPAITKLGDLYELGKHKVLCGDSTQQEAVLRIMGNKKARVCFTSPPYWLGFEYEQEKNLEEIIKHIDKQAKQLSKVVEGKIIINTANIASITKAEKITGKKQVALLVDWWQQALNKYNFYLRHIRIWAKAGQMMACARNDSVDMHWEYLETFTPEYETAGLIANFYNKARKFYGQNKLGNFGKDWATSGIWTDIKGNARDNGHVAAFPAQLVWRNLLMYSDEKDLIYEPYLGSGTTIIASEKVNRICYAIELNPHYTDISIQRYCDYVGNYKVKRNGQEITWGKEE